MHTVLQILKAAGGWNHGLYLRIENPPFMALVIEATDESGPCGLPALSVAHYEKSASRNQSGRAFSNGDIWANALLETTE
jgi:hypothetical protein